MLEQMEDDEILSILSMNVSDEEKAAELVKRTVDNADNHSAYLLHIKDVEHEPGDELLVSDEEEARRKNKALNDTRKDEVWDKSMQESPMSAATSQEAVPQESSNKKKFILPLILFLIALGVAAFLLFGGEGKKTVEESQDDEPTTEKVMTNDEDAVTDGEEEVSAKEEVMRQRELQEPDQEPQSLKPQSSEKNMPNVRIEGGLDF